MSISGVYADLDFECLRPLDDLLAGHTAVVARMTDEDWDQARVLLCQAIPVWHNHHVQPPHVIADFPLQHIRPVIYIDHHIVAALCSASDLATQRLLEWPACLCSAQPMMLGMCIARRQL